MPDIPEDPTAARSAEPPSPHLHDVLATVLSRRALLGSGLGAAMAAWAPAGAAEAPTPAAPGRLKFEAVGAAGQDLVTVPPGYRAQVLYAWGDAIGRPDASGRLPAWRGDAAEDAAAQALQAGMHHDGMHFFPLPRGRGGDASAHGLLALNHEYVDHGLLFPDGSAQWSAAKVRKSQAAHGVSVIEVRRAAGGMWEVVRPSRHARRITANTPMRLSGPAAARLGGVATGTFANCANGWTPWGTYLTCEENWHGYFAIGDPAAQALFKPDEVEAGYGIRPAGEGVDWHLHDARFDLAANRSEPQRFGWVVEIDPFDPRSTPVKHTAMGRMRHEGAAPATAKDGRVVFYMGDDQPDQYVYKFVSRGRFRANKPSANRRLLEDGTLYVARFDAAPAQGGRLATGRWLPLSRDDARLAARFASQGELLVATRLAAKLVGATPMDRPEWIAVHPQRSGEVYCALTNNAERGKAGRPAPDAANPRAGNVYGHVIRWHEAGGDAAAETFEWDIFVMGGDPELAARPQPPANAHPGAFSGDYFGSPDGLAFDPSGRLWIQTDISSDKLGKGAYERMPANMALAADPDTREVRRFLTGPPGCEITGMSFTPDGRTLFVNIQHPGEGGDAAGGRPNALSTWPSSQGYGPQAGGDTPAQHLRPRSATVVVTRDDGGVIGG